MGVARQFLADAEWVTKLIENRMEDIRPCICCHNACFNMSHYKGVANAQSIYDASHIARCALDPRVMQSDKYKIVPAKVKKKVAVIGGGIGGMESALVLAKRGHDVTLYEKSNALGGVFIAASSPSFKEKDRMLIAWYVRELKKYKNIKVKMKTEVVDINTLDADEVIIATGAKARKLPVKGAERCVEAVDYLLGKAQVGTNVVIVGGGLTGCEIAYELYLNGKKPVIVEAKNDLIVSKGVCLANSSYLRDFFTAYKVPVYLESSVSEIGKKDVVIRKNTGEELKVKADTVITSIGYNPAPLVEKKKKNVHIVGDANAVGNLRTVIWGAWDVCMKI